MNDHEIELLSQFPVKFEVDDDDSKEKKFLR